MAYVSQPPLMASSLPPDVDQAVAAMQLGDRLLSKYRVAMTAKRVLSAITLIAVGVLMIGLGVGVQGQIVDSSGLLVLVILVVMGLAFAVGGLYNMFYGAIYKNWGVYVYERGFVYKRGGQAAQPFRWDLVESVYYQVTRRYYNGIYTGTIHNYRVRRQDGYEIYLNDRFANVATLGDLISNHVTAAKLPQVMAAYSAGQTIIFGPLSLNTQGIWNANGTLLPWPEVKDVSIQSGYIALSKAGKWLRWSSQPVRSIPNVFLFVAMVRAILRK